MTQLNYSINKSPQGVGSLGIGDIKDESKIRVIIEDAGATNNVRVRARIIGQTDWDTLADITGNAKQVISVVTYDELEFLVTVFDSPSGILKVIATSFSEAGGSTTIDAPTGGSVIGDIIFTSSDNSITMVADPDTNTIDFTTGDGVVESVNGESGIVTLDTDDINEGTTNLYFTDGRAQTAVISQVINNGVINKSPSEDAVFDALALKVTGPASSTDNAITRFDGTSGKLIQNSVSSLDDTGNLSGIASIAASGTVTLGSLSTGVVHSNGSGVLSSSDVDLTTDVSGILPIANGGTGSATQNFSDLNQMSTSLLTDATMTIDADTTKFNVPAFAARFLDNYTNPSSPTYTILNYAGSTSNSVTNLAIQDTTVITIDKNGTIYQGNMFPSPSENRDRIQVGTLIHTSRTVIDSIASFTGNIGIDVPASMYDMSNAIGPVNIAGNIITGNLSSGLKINKTAGATFQVGINWAFDKKTPNNTVDAALTAPFFFYSYRNGSGGFTVSITDTIVPGRYDDGTGGVGIPNGLITSNRWQLFKIYRVQSTNQITIEYGQQEFNTLALAIAGKSSETVVNPSIAATQFRGWLAVRGGATNLTLSSDATFIDAGKFSQTTSGGSLGSSTTSLQGAYNNSVTPQIITTTALGALDIKRGSTSDTDNVIRTLNGAGIETASITGAGTITGSNLTGTNTGDQTALTVPFIPSGDITAVNVQNAIVELDNEKVAKITGDIYPTSYSLSNNQAVAANVTGLLFNTGVVRSFDALVSVSIDATSDLYEEFNLQGINKSGTYEMSTESVGDDSGVVFTITSAGQIQYTSTNNVGFVSGTIKFRAITTQV